MRKILITTITILFFLTACQVIPKSIQTPVPREFLSISDVESTTSAFEALARAEGEAWHSPDNRAFRAVFSEDAIFTDRTFGDHAVGIEAIEALSASMALGLAPSWKAQGTDRYIGLEGGLEVVNIWDLELGGYKFSEADPQVELDWLQTRGNSITAMTVLYSLDSMKKSYGAPRERLDQANSLLSSYQSAWSSGDPRAVAGLYASEAVREDSIFGEKQQGGEAIGSFAKLFFAWYPGAQWSLSLGFGEGRGDAPMTGGLYALRVNDLAGQPCDVQAAVLLQVSEDQILHEEVFYEPQSLVKCGWAR